MTLLDLLLLCTPQGGLVGLAPGVVKLHEPLESLGLGWLATRGNLRCALPHPFVACHQQWLGAGVLFLAEQTAAEQRLSVERGPVIGLYLFPNGEAFTEERLG